jgi:putative zinc finger/helix-turn-helix YgiT family protein
VFDNEADEQIARALREQLGLLSGELIRKNRDELGLSQRELAEHLGVATETISRWETGALTQTRAMDRYLRLYFNVPAARAALAAG